MVKAHAHQVVQCSGAVEWTGRVRMAGWSSAVEGMGEIALESVEGLLETRGAVETGWGA